MPRTKAPRKRGKKSSKGGDELLPEASPAVLAELNDVRLQWKLRREALISKRDDVIVSIRRAFDMVLMAQGPTNNYLLRWDSEDEDVENGQPTETAQMDNSVSTSVASPDYVSVTSSIAPSDVTSTTGRHSRSQTRQLLAKTPAPRSSSANAAYQTASRTLRSSSAGRDRLAELATCRGGNMPPPSSRLNRFRTPATNLAADGSRYNLITPKAVPNSSFAVLRRPQVGEMVFAMTGSPVMVGSNGEDICNINVPLGDGRMVSILPNVMRPRDLPDINEDVMEQMVQLRNNLNFIIQDKIAGTKH